MIKSIKIQHLKKHPNNPRKEYREIEELADSIKAQGILQNLTVVPDPKVKGDYLVVIGNRRLEAGTLAGLEELPCSISDMSEKEQAATMLLENMQRNDLTVYEEAQGFQMCLDLGMSEKELVADTGLSKTTIKKRINILQFDQEKVKEVVDSGATLFDFQKLQEIKNPEKRKEVMEKMGTNNFDWAFRNAIEEQKKKVLYDKIIKKISSYAKEVEETPAEDKYMVSESVYTGYLREYDYENMKEPIEGAKYLFVIDEEYNRIRVYKEITEEDRKKAKKAAEAPVEKTRWQVEAEEREERNSQAKDIGGQLFQLRKDFMLGNKKKALEEKDLYYYAALIMATYSTTISKEDDRLLEPEFQDWLFKSIYKIDEPLYAEDIGNVIKKNYKKGLERIIYCSLEYDGLPITWEGYFDSNPTTELLYEFLEKQGYVKSDLEIEILNGTHEIYVEEIEED